MMDHGIVLVAGKKQKYFDEASYFAKSLKKHNKGIKIALFCDRTFSSKEFDLVENISHIGHPQKYKMHAILNSPFDRTLYLDVDMEARGNIQELFHFLDFYHVGLTHRVKCKWPPNATPTFLDYVDHECIQTGFLLIKKSDITTELISDWQHTFSEVPDSNISTGTPFGDQAAFNTIWPEWEANPYLKHIFLPNKIYNVRPWMWNQLKKDGLWSQTKILHTHGLNTPRHLVLLKKIKHRLSRMFEK